MIRFMPNQKKAVRDLRKMGIALLTLCACLGWWGFLYPQLSMTPDTYRVIREDGTVQEEEEVVKWDFEGSIYTEILNAGSGRIRFRSALLERISQYLEDWKKE